MKCYAYKELASGEIRIIHTDGDAEAIMKMASPDVISGGAGTAEDPHTYSPTAEFMGEMPKDADGKYIMPNRAFRASWRDNAGAVEVDMPLAREEKMVAIRAERDKLLVESDEQWVEIASQGGDQTAIQAYKQALRDLPAAEQALVDALADDAALEAHEASFPAKP